MTDGKVTVLSAHLERNKLTPREKIKMPNKRNQNAKFAIKDGQLVISIGIEAVKRSIEVDTDLSVDNDLEVVFAIKSVISSEEENGRTPFHQMLAEAAYSAYEDGEQGFTAFED